MQLLNPRNHRLSSSVITGPSTSSNPKTILPPVTMTALAESRDRALQSNNYYKYIITVRENPMGFLVVSGESEFQKEMIIRPDL